MNARITPFLPVVALIACSFFVQPASAQIDPAMIMTLTSSELADGAQMADDYTCKGFNVSPPLTIGRLPAETVSVVLVMEDLDGIDGERVHWIVRGISPEDLEFERGSIPEGAVSGKNDYGKAGYTGPCPKAGNHRYQFTAYALDGKLDVPMDAAPSKVLAAMQGHILMQATLTAKFASDAE